MRDHFKRSASSLLLTTFCLLVAVYLASCKSSVIPPEIKPPGPDTTSHNFVWRIDTLGDGNASVLNDVVILDENNIWAVGEIYLKDSTGQFEFPPYSVAKWNGNSWSLHRVYYQNGPNQLIVSPIRGIWKTGSNEYWLAAGSIFRWDGVSSLTQLSFSRLSLTDQNGTIEKLWGSSGTNIYGIGNVGSIVRFNGVGWQQLASGTSVDIQDIWGATSTQGAEVIAVASALIAGRELDLLRIDGVTVTKLDTTGLPVNLSGVWFDPENTYFLSGNGLYAKRTLSDLVWVKDEGHSNLFKDRIRGASINDVFIVGSGGLVSHFNGSTWRDYNGIELPQGTARYTGLSISGNVFACVGGIPDKAIAIIGQR